MTSPREISCRNTNWRKTFVYRRSRLRRMENPQLRRVSFERSGRVGFDVMEMSRSMERFMEEVMEEFMEIHDDNSP